jgi:hypothetical protein
LLSLGLGTRFGAHHVPRVFSDYLAMKEPWKACLTSETSSLHKRPPSSWTQMTEQGHSPKYDLQSHCVPSYFKASYPTLLKCQGRSPSSSHANTFDKSSLHRRTHVACSSSAQLRCTLEDALVSRKNLWSQQASLNPDRNNHHQATNMSMS